MNSTRIQPMDARNAQIVTLLCSGYMPKQIAQEVGMSELAIRARLFRIRQKEGVQSNIALVGKVLEARWANQAKNRRASQGGHAA